MEEQSKTPEKPHQAKSKAPHEPPLLPREKLPAPVNPWIWLGIVALIFVLVLWKGAMRDDAATARQREVLIERIEASEKAKTQGRNINVPPVRQR